MGKYIQITWYALFKNRFFSLLKVILIGAIFISGCSTNAPLVSMDTPIPENTIQATITATPSISAEIIQQIGATPTVEQPISGTVTLWHSWTEKEQVALLRIINKFKKINPDVIVNLQYVPFDDLYKKSTIRGEGGGPDLLIGPSDWGPELFETDLVADVSTIVRQKFFEKISPAALQSVQYRNAITGLPFAYSRGIVIFRNQSILPDVQPTFEEYMQAAKDKTRGDIVGAVIDLGFFQSGAFLEACGGEWMDARGAPLFDNEAGLCWIQLQKNIQESGLPVELNTNTDLERFQAGKVGMIIAGTWEATRLSEAIGANNLAIDPWPSYENENLAGFFETEAIYLSNQVTPENLEASRALVRYFLTGFAQNTLADPKTAAKVPTLINIEIKDRLMKESLAAFETGTPLPSLPEMAYYWEPLDEALRSILLEGADPKQALQKAAIQIRLKARAIQSDE